MTTTDRHVPACRCIWCASDPDKDTTREALSEECGAPHPYAGGLCTRLSGHAGGHGNADRAWLPQTLHEAPSVTQEGSGADRGRFVSRPEPEKTGPSPVISLSPPREISGGSR